MAGTSDPQTLQEAILFFADPANCRNYLVPRRWPNGVACPKCGSKDVLFLEKYNRWNCRAKHPAPQFTLKTGTIMEDSPLGLDKWLTAMWQIVNCKNGISSYEVHRALGITQKTAWFLDHRIRLALTMGTFNKFSGQIDADETYIGGKACNIHASKKAVKITGTGGKGETAVIGILERGGKVYTKVVHNVKKKSLQSEIRQHVPAESAIFTDALKSYEGLYEFQHEVVDHAVEYVCGEVHTNGMENFWSLLKRGLRDTYVAVELFHLFRYLDEQGFRYNNRKMTDADRLGIAIRQTVGKRITFHQLTGRRPHNE
ncbi:MAG TPA: IS1595 family transposase [Bryobacteraceae bacterium]|nr:IS1595 family transposase [Bryobacteraceae bacterium]